MSFLVAPATLRLGAPSLDWSAYWYDIGARLRLVRWTKASDQSEEYAVADEDHLAPSVLVDGSALALQRGLVNGAPHYAGLNRHVFLSASGEWVLHTALAEPRAWQLSNGGEWHGDGWWALAGFDPDDLDAAVTPAARGLWINAADAPAIAPAVSWSWPRWIRDEGESGASEEPFGVYVASVQGMTPPRRTVGCMRFVEDGSGVGWVESLDGARFVRESGREVLSEKPGGVWATEGWSASGKGAWWQTGAKPKRTGGATLVAMKREEAGGQAVRDLTKDPVALAFHSFVTSGEKQSVRMAEVALWR